MRRQQKQRHPNHSHQRDIGVEVLRESGAYTRDLLLRNDSAKLSRSSGGKPRIFRARLVTRNRLTAGSAEARGVGELCATLRAEHICRFNYNTNVAIGRSLTVQLPNA